MQEGRSSVVVVGGALTLTLGVSINMYVHLYTYIEVHTHINVVVGISGALETGHTRVIFLSRLTDAIEMQWELLLHCGCGGRSCANEDTGSVCRYVCKPI